MSIRLEQFRDPALHTSGAEDTIGFYPREFYMLDNFSAFQVEWRGHVWPTSEHGYHFPKFTETALHVAELIKQTRSPHDAFKIAVEHRELVRPDWDEIKVPTMEDLNRHKLAQHPYIQKKLLQTVGLTIVEDSPKDSFWGWGPDRTGRNELGKIWMRLRDELVENQ